MKGSRLSLVRSTVCHGEELEFRRGKCDSQGLGHAV